jgi:hypothetical protein
MMATIYLKVRAFQFLNNQKLLDAVITGSLQIEVYLVETVQLAFSILLMLAIMHVVIYAPRALGLIMVYAMIAFLQLTFIICTASPSTIAIKGPHFNCSILPSIILLFLVELLS